MTIWRYIGCEISEVPKDMIDKDDLSPGQIRELLNTVPTVDSYIEAATIDSLVALLLNDGIFPIKIHPLDDDENNLNRLKRFRIKVNNIIKNSK